MDKGTGATNLVEEILHLSLLDIAREVADVNCPAPTPTHPSLLQHINQKSTIITIKRMMYRNAAFRYNQKRAIKHS